MAVDTFYAHVRNIAATANPRAVATVAHASPGKGMTLEERRYLLPWIRRHAARSRELSQVNRAQQQTIRRLSAEVQALRTDLRAALASVEFLEDTIERTGLARVIRP
jgi:hypothetical protein